ncbi:MAG: hypothetical protein CFE45_12525, partial [Burkholderiales bacterium PBB5]
EKRARETVQHGAPRSPYLKTGDTVRIEIKGSDGQSVFGAIEQRVSGPDDGAPDAADEADAPTPDDNLAGDGDDGEGGTA